MSALARSALVRNSLATVASFVGATVWTKLLSRLVSRKKLTPHAARKLMHITTAPFFSMTWPLYADNRAASFFAASVPALFAVRIWLHPRSDPLVRAVAREQQHVDAVGQADKDASQSRHALWNKASGPFSYGLSVAVITALTWRTKAVTYVSLAALCFGDGMADVVGSAVNASPLPLPRNLFWKKKTLPGSLALFASTVATAPLWPHVMLGSSVTPMSRASLVRAALAAALAEVFPVEDNVTVPLAALVAYAGSRPTLAVH